jgi:hypothetical protein
VRMTMLSDFGVALTSASVLSFAMEFSSFAEFDSLAGTVGGAVLEARVSRCLVTLFKPMRT